MDFDISSVDHRMLDDLFEAFSLIGRGEYVSLYDAKRQLTRYSPAAADLFGFPEYIPYGAYNWSDYVHPEDRRRYETVMRSLIEGNAQGYDISYRVLLKDGSYALVRFIGAVIRDEEGKPEFIGGIMINEGLTEDTDPITVLRNQYGFFQDLSAAIELRKKCSMLLIGIGKMTEINDANGYGYGNRVLQHLAWYLQEIFGTDGTVYRIDGAKFAFLTETLSPEEIAARYEKVRRYTLGGLSVDNVRQVLVINGGIISYEGNIDVDERTIFSCLSLAYHNSKTRRNGKLVSYNGAIGRDIRESFEMINEIRNCILMDCEGFSLRYQPIVAADTEKITAVEALLCWHSEKFGDVSPAAYVPVLERDFLFEELGYWIFKQAMTDGRKLLDKNPDLTMSVNVAPAQIVDELLISELEKISHRTNFPLDHLCFELTAHCRQIETEVLRSVIFALKEKGVRCLLDDFGGGVASIDFLQILQPEYIKPEKKYIANIETDEGSRCIVQHLTNMAAGLGTKVCIKGVSNANIRDLVKKFPIRSMQGHFYAEPMYFDELNRWVDYQMGR